MVSQQSYSPMCHAMHWHNMGSHDARMHKPITLGAQNSNCRTSSQIQIQLVLVYDAKPHMQANRNTHKTQSTLVTRASRHCVYSRRSRRGRVLQSLPLDFLAVLSLLLSVEHKGIRLCRAVWVGRVQKFLHRQRRLGVNLNGCSCTHLTTYGMMSCMAPARPMLSIKSGTQSDTRTVHT